jgi:hypothetical protein
MCAILKININLIASNKLQLNDSVIRMLPFNLSQTADKGRSRTWRLDVGLTNPGNTEISMLLNGIQNLAVTGCCEFGNEPPR